MVKTGWQRAKKRDDEVIGFRYEGGEWGKVLVLRNRSLNFYIVYVTLKEEFKSYQRVT